MQSTNERRNGFIWGVLLIAAGLIFLLQNMGFFSNIGAWLAMVLFATGGFAFLYTFLTNLHERWWAAIPGATLLGLAATIFFDSYGPRFLNGLGGPAFLASIGFGFVLVFLADVRKWWAIIPAGVMSTLAVVAGVDQLPFLGAGRRGVDSGSIFFLGLGFTFLLLYLLTGQREKRQSWALIPAAVMLIMGVLIGTPWIGYTGNLWPLALIAVGAYWVWRNFNGDSHNRHINSQADESSTSQETVEDQ